MRPDKPDCSNYDCTLDLLQNKFRFTNVEEPNGVVRLASNFTTSADYNGVFVVIIRQLSQIINHHGVNCVLTVLQIILLIKPREPSYGKLYDEDALISMVNDDYVWSIVV
uniref:Uncharacterized protein n=1 Tax=Ditylenchus dipsaci TaxID=166011 RepID=A0A915EQM1_9BILA